MSTPPLPAAADDLATLETARAWRNQGHPVVLATILDTWGSAPRGPGSFMAIHADGRFVGSVSGGCIEGALLLLAEKRLLLPSFTVHTFGVSHENAWEAGLACGGTVVVRLDRIAGKDGDLPDAVLEALLATSSRRQAITLVFPVDGAPHLDPTSSERATSTCEDGTLRRPFPPAYRLLVVGGGHISQALCAMARIMGIEVHVIDPRAAFVHPDRFPDTHIHIAWPDEVFDQLTLDPGTGVVALTHDAKIDDVALFAAIHAPCGYIGALGSTRSHAKRCARLAERGAAQASIDRIFGPVGLPIGGRAPTDIALSILAQVMQVRNGR